MSELAGFVTVAHSNTVVFPSVLTHDMLIYPETSNQRIFLGTKSNAEPAVLIGSNGIIVTGDINLRGNLLSNGTQYGVGIANNSSNLYIFGSNLGIGTSNPLADLHIKSNLRVDGSLEVYRPMKITGIEFYPTDLTQNNFTQITASTSNILGLSNLATGLQFYLGNNTSTMFFQYKGDANEIMRITGNGLIGIGTPTPTYTLDVVGIINGTKYLASNDSAAAPAYTWSNNSNTGMYNAGTNTIGFACGGTNCITLCNIGIVTGLLTGNKHITASNDSVSAPSYTWFSSSNTGLYLAGTNTIGIACGGSNSITMSNNMITIP